MAEIAVLVIDPNASKHAELLDDSCLIRDVIPVLVRRLGLPKDLNYQLIHTTAGRPLVVNHSLAQADVFPGDELRIVAAHDEVYDAVTRQLYKLAKDYVRDRLWDMAREKLEELHRVEPNYPDPAGITRVVYDYAVNPRPIDVEPRKRPQRDRPRRRDLDSGRIAAATTTRAVASGTGIIGKLVGFTLFCGMVAASGYTAWQDPTARVWMTRQIAQMTGKQAASSDVLTALRETGKEHGWKNEVCEELPNEKLKELMAIIDPNMKTVNVRMYVLGDRRTGNLEGIPMSNRSLMVGEYENEQSAKLFIDNAYRNLDSVYPGKVSHVKIANCDDGLRLSTTIGEAEMTQSYARKGRCVMLYYSSSEESMIGADRIETLFASLGRRLPAK